MLEDKPQLPSSSFQTPNLESGSSSVTSEDVEKLRQTAEEALRGYRPSLEKELISRWRSGAKGPQPPKAEKGLGGGSEPKSESSGKRMLPQEREAMFKQKKFEPYAPSVEVPSPSKPSMPEKPEPEEYTPNGRNILRGALNILVVLLVVGSAAVAGYWYTRRNIRPTIPPITELPVSDGGAEIPAVPPVTPPEATPPATEPPVAEELPIVEPVSAWSRLKNKPSAFVVEFPKGWFVYPEEAPKASGNILISNKALSSIPDNPAEIEVGSFDLLVVIEPRSDGELPGMSLRPKDYASGYSQIAEKILGSLQAYSPIEVTPSRDYVNTIDNYTLNYPEDWQDKGLDSSEQGLFKTFSSSDGAVTLRLGTLKIADLEEFKGKAADAVYFDYLKNQNEGEERAGDPQYKITNLGKFNLGGREAVKQSEVSESEFNVAYYMLRDTAVFRIRANFSSESVWLSYEEASERILSTLQFK